MKILITGNMGYVGPVLVNHLRQVNPGSTIIGVDQGYYAGCLTNQDYFPECLVDIQYFSDIRELTFDLLEGVDAVVHLAAISNDPMGNQFEAVTNEINYLAGKRLAEAARDRGVKYFVFASSCSMYGSADGNARKEEDTLNPLTAYARSKVAMEEVLSSLNDNNMVITALRFATACGMSNRLRLDLVLNDFVACAVSTGKITVLSDGTPWRPLIDVNDMARAIQWAATRSIDNGGPYLRVNAGSNNWNYQVKELATAVAEIIPGTSVHINNNAPPDKRSYRVDFSLFEKLAPEYKPKTSLEQSISELWQGLKAMNFHDDNFRESNYIRLKVLEKHIKNGLLDNDLRWK